MDSGGEEDRERSQEEDQHTHHQQSQQFQNYRHPYMGYAYQMDPSWLQMHGHHFQIPMAYGYQYPLLHRMEGVPLPPGIPGLGGSTDPLEAVLGPFPCVRLKNLPYDASLEDILVLFQGLVVLDVIIVGNGEAFIIFANPMDFQMALQRNRQPLGHQFVEISASSRDDYYAAIAKQHMQEQEGARRGGGAARAAATRGEGFGGERKQSGDASSTAATAPPTAGLWGGTAGSPPLSSLADAAAYGDTMAQQQPLPLGGGMAMGIGSRGGPPRGASSAPVQKRTGGGIQVGDHTGFLRMRGLPFTAAKDDIFKFFEGYNPVQESIVLTYRNDGRATGEAYVGFASPDDSKRAMDLHRRMMGSRYIELFISNKEEQGRALARFGNR